MNAKQINTKLNVENHKNLWISLSMIVAVLSAIVFILIVKFNSFTYNTFAEIKFAPNSSACTWLIFASIIILGLLPLLFNYSYFKSNANAPQVLVRIYFLLLSNIILFMLFGLFVMLKLTLVSIITISINSLVLIVTSYNLYKICVGSGIITTLIYFLSNFYIMLSLAYYCL